MKIEMISKAVICATSPLMYPGKPGMKFWEATTLQHDCSSPVFYHILSFMTISGFLYRNYFPIPFFDSLKILLIKLYHFLLTITDNIRLAFEQAEHERQFLIKRVTEGKATSSKKQGRPEGSCNIKTDKAEHIKQTIKDLSKDFGGKYSDAKILREYLHNTSKGTYYKYKKELKEEIA